MVHISQKLSMQLRQSPQQVLLSSLLQLPVLSLEQRIRMELETNPLLELDMEDEVVQDLENAPEIGVEQPEPVEGGRECGQGPLKRDRLGRNSERSGKL